MDSSTIINIDSVKEKNNVKVINNEGYFEEKFYTEDIFTDKEFTSISKNAVRQVRFSNEYKDYIKFIKTEVKLNRCAFLGEIDDEKAEIELHHYPFTIQDIADIILTYNLEKGNKVSTFKIAKEVMECHYKNMIGLVPLCVTVHELAHAGKLFINLNQIFGNVNEFIEKYKDGIGTELIKKLNKLIEMSNENEVDVAILKHGKLVWDIDNKEELKHIL